MDVYPKSALTGDQPGGVALFDRSMEGALELKTEYSELVVTRPSEYARWGSFAYCVNRPAAKRSHDGLSFPLIGWSWKDAGSVSPQTQIGSPSALLKGALLDNRPLQLAVRPFGPNLALLADLPSPETCPPMPSSSACPSIEKREPRSTAYC